MNAWHLTRMLALDFETTGVETESDRIVTAAAYRVGGGQPVQDADWLLDPGIEIPAGAVAVHKISTEHAREHGIPAARGVEEIATAIAKAIDEGLPIVGHNVGLYDLPLLDAECRRHLNGSLTDICGRPVGPVIDTRVLDQQVIKKRKKTSDHGPRTLRTTAQVYGLPWDDDNAHGASYDALQSARIAWHIGNIAHLPAKSRPGWVRDSHRFDSLAGLSLNELHERQVVWAREQCASLEAFLKQRDPSVVIDGSWPLKARA
jgi:DNA polymerase-3 subunit epsilon